MTDKSHAELLDVLKSLKGKVLLSSYDNELYSSLGWRTETKESRADKAGLRTEILYLNW
jgi:DNA adenine methylase